MRTLIAIGVVLGTWSGAEARANAQTPEEAEEAPPNPELPAAGSGERIEEDDVLSDAAAAGAVALVRALERRLTVWEHGGRRAYVRH